MEDGAERNETRPYDFTAESLEEGRAGVWWGGSREQAK